MQGLAPKCSEERFGFKVGVYVNSDYKYSVVLKGPGKVFWWATMGTSFMGVGFNRSGVAGGPLSAV